MEKPELAVVAAQGPDHPAIRSLASQLLEQGVHFCDAGQQIAATLPADLAGYRAVLLDAPAMAATRADAGQWRRLDAFARAGGFVFGMADPMSGLPARGLNANQVLDAAAQYKVHEVVLHAALTRHHPAMRAIQRQRPDSDIIATMKDHILQSVTTRRIWDEFTLHYWKAALHLAKLDHDDVREAMIQAVRESAEQVPEAPHHDRLGGFFATAWLHDQTGDDGPLRRAQARVDQMLARQPREMGILSGCGFDDDPLGAGSQTPDRLDIQLTGSTMRRRVIWTEGLHFIAPTLASMARATGDRRYLDELTRMVAHYARFHVRADGVIEHCTRDGKPVAAPWGRGHTHALYGCLYALEELDPREPPAGMIVDMLRRVGAGLLRHQDPDTGLWRNVIDHPDARLETTATCGIASVYGRCVHEGWLERGPWAGMVERAWQGLKLMYWRGGVGATCRGTAAGDVTYYLGRPQGWLALPQLVMARPAWQA